MLEIIDVKFIYLKSKCNTVVSDFYFFIVSLAILDIFIGVCATVHLALLTNEKKAFIEALKHSRTFIFFAFLFDKIIKFSAVSAAIFLITFFSIWSVAGLSGFHTYLLATSQTTNEDVSHSFAPHPA